LKTRMKTSKQVLMNRLHETHHEKNKTTQHQIQSHQKIHIKHINIRYTTEQTQKTIMK
jgi:hypothetical protein